MREDGGADDAARFDGDLQSAVPLQAEADVVGEVFVTVARVEHYPRLLQNEKRTIANENCGIKRPRSPRNRMQAFHSGDRPTPQTDGPARAVQRLPIASRSGLSEWRGNMKRKLVLSLIACAGLSFASATVALADDPAPDTSATGSSTDTTQTTREAGEPTCPLFGRKLTPLAPGANGCF